MKLMTPRQAAIESGTTYAMVTYWVRTEHLTKYPIEGKVRQYLVDVEQLKKIKGRNKFDLIREKFPPNLVTPKEAADAIWVVERMIGYYVKKGYIKAHYVFGNNLHYLVDINEVKMQPKLIPDRMRHQHRLDELREQALRIPKDANGWWTKTVAN